MAIVCKLQKESYSPGEIVICLLKGLKLYTKELYDSTIVAYVHGYLNVDHRWLNNSKLLQDIYEFDQNHIDLGYLLDRDPLSCSNHSFSKCIYFSPEVPLSPKSLFLNGIFLEFEIPEFIIPSYRGLLATINYFITVTFQSSQYTSKFHFPLIVKGLGNSKCLSSVTYSYLVSYPVEYIMSHNYSYEGEFEVEDAVYQEQNESEKEVNNVYMIRDKDFICSLIINESLQAVIGKEFMMRLDFRNSIQPCYATKASIIMSEERSDGSTLQEKVIASVIKSTVDAELLYLSLLIPIDSATSFQCDIFKVSFKVKLDFCLFSQSFSKEGVNSIDNSFSFSIPIVMKNNNESSNEKNSKRDIFRMANSCLCDGNVVPSLTTKFE